MSEMVKGLMNRARFLFMPGLDLFTRRRLRLCRHWLQGDRNFLDAGSGNGWFSYLAWRSGAKVLAVNYSKQDVAKAKDFYNAWMGIPEEKLRFEVMNLYEAAQIKTRFHEIICYETLEHIRDDAKVCRIFWDLLEPGGILHLCCPHAEHPRWRNETLDLEEKGYHVRAGYTLASYKALLEPIGFEIRRTDGMGGRVLAFVSGLLGKLRTRWGDARSFPLALLAMPLVWTDPGSPACPYSLYVKAVKRSQE